MTTIETPNNKIEAPVKSPEVMFGTGRYSNVMKELFRDSQRMLGLSEAQAEKLAKTFGADLGRFVTKADSIGISKPNKDMQVTLRESCKVKGISLTNSLVLAKLVAGLQELKIYGVEKYDKITLSPEITEWLKS